MMILFNPRAGGGKAPDKWRRLLATLPPFREDIDLQFLTGKCDIATSVSEAASRHEGHLLAAGGDGTVNSLLNVVMHLPDTQRQHVVFGAVGLGSSNDFHKPFEAGRMIEGIPVRVDFHKPSWRDVGRVLIRHRGHSTLHYFMINASAGITAEGNVLFNEAGSLLGLLKRHATPFAILYAAISALAAHKNQICTIEMRDRPPVHLNLTNLGIIKSPHFSGSLRYDSPAHYDDGNFHVHAAVDMGFIERLGLLNALSHGRFHALTKTHSWVTPEITLAAPSPFMLELDGEIHEADSAEFTVVPQAIRVCS